MKASAKNLFRREKKYKEAVKDISFAIEPGECVGFIGPNGAGKTTTMKMLSGILHPTGGSALVNGYVPWERKTEFRKSMAFVAEQKSQLWVDLPAEESFYLNKCIYEISDADYRKTVGELTEMLGVQELLKIQVRRLSLGEKMKMELIAALLHRPKVIFLDEPTIGLDVLSQTALREYLRAYNRQTGATLLLTSHYTQDIERVCDLVYVVIAGAVNIFVETGIERAVCSDIHSGALGSYLHKPVYYILFQSARAMGRKMPPMCIMCLFTAAALGVLYAAVDFFVTPWVIAAWLLAVFFALLLNLALCLLISFSGFWLTKANYFFSAMKVTISVLSGGVFPITVFGTAYAAILKWLPFSYTRYFPITILTGSLAVREIAFGLLTQMTWSLILFGLAALVWSRGIRRFSAVGG